MEALKELFTAGDWVGISLLLLKPILILVVCKIVISIVTKILGKTIDKSKLEKGMSGFVKSTVKILLWCIAVIIAAGSVGIDTSSLVAVLGVVSLALSLSFQGIMTNVFSGIIILISQPFKVGDYVEIAGVGGTVKEINLMRTILVTPDCKIESVPNGDVCASRITNYSIEPMRRVEIKLGVSYDDSTQDVRNAVIEVLNSDSRIKQIEGKEPTVKLTAYNANDIEYTIRFWTDSADYWAAYFDAMEQIRESFIKHKISFSYPHTIVHIDKN